MVNFSLSAIPLADNFSGTPQELFQAFLDRFKVAADTGTYVLGGTTAPALGSGLWFKGGTQLYVDNGSAYVPVTTTASITPQIWVGETAPDSLVYPLWLKLSGVVVLGLFYFAGTTLGWLRQENVPGPLSITTAKLADGAVTTNKLGDASIRGDNIAGNIPTSKWDRGNADTFLRMNRAGDLPLWDATHVVSPEIDLTVSDVTEYVHNLGATPHMVTAALVCRGTGADGWALGDEVPLCQCFATYYPSLYKSPSRVFTRLVTSLQVPAKSTFALTAVTLANWKIKFYITAS